MDKCGKCKGTGKIQYSNYGMWVECDCPECEGTGRSWKARAEAAEARAKQLVADVMDIGMMAAPNLRGPEQDKELLLCQIADHCDRALFTAAAKTAGSTVEARAPKGD